jgi:hypothetical protein
MTWIIETESKRHLPARLAAGLALAAFLVLGTFVASASAQPHRDDHHGGDHRGGDRGGGDHRGGGPGWGGGGYYVAPPVIYGGPVYYPPPVIYGPTVGIVLPGVAIGIQ